VIAITDEVYEHILYDGATHTRLATLPGMADRTLTISSLGKTFSVTGWKIGWALGTQPLVDGLNRAHQFITFAVSSPLQMAAATALNLPATYYEELQATYQGKRDYLLARCKRRVSKRSGRTAATSSWSTGEALRQRISRTTCSSRGG